MTDRIEDKDPALLTRIRQLARKGLNRSEIFRVVRNEGRLSCFETLRKIIRRCNIAVVHASRVQDLDERTRQMRLALSKARRELAREIAEARALAITAAPYKRGDLKW